VEVSDNKVPRKSETWIRPQWPF